jgi:ribosome-associated protein
MEAAIRGLTERPGQPGRSPGPKGLITAAEKQYDSRPYATLAPMTEETDERPTRSKSERKRQMHALQEIGEALVELQASEFDTLDLPENLRDAVEEARRTRGFEAKRRQLQYIGKLMRHVDPEPIRERIETLRAASASDVARLHRVERWRDRVLEDPEALTLFMSEYPATDGQQLRSLIRQAETERGRHAPPRAYRSLFQFLRNAIESGNKAAVEAAEDAASGGE